MKKVFEVEDKIISLFSNDYSLKKVPIIILNTFDEDGQKIWEKTQELSQNEFVLVTISNVNWNGEMSPWYMDRLFKGEEDYSGNADAYIEKLVNKIIPKIEENLNELEIEVSEYILAGYSLAGLFAIYSLYKTDKFNKIVSCSGSLWYPNFIDFIKNNNFIRKPQKVYFSLGNKESKTKNELMSRVQENTIMAEEIFKEKGCITIYEENEGNHFQDVINRISKGIAWILN